MFSKNLKKTVLSATLLTALSAYAVPDMMMEDGEEAGSFGAGNGGDGVVLQGTSSNGKNIYPMVNFEAALERAIQSAYNRERQLYSLDLVDMGIAKNPKIDFNAEATKNSDKVCIESAGCYNVLNSELFDELIDYEGFFGVAAFEMKDAPRIELATTSELGNLYSSYEMLYEKYSKKSWANFEAQIAKDKGLYSKEEVQKDLKRAKAAAKKYTNAALGHHKNLRSNFYSKNAILAVGLINKIEQIKKVDSQFAELFTDTLIELEWEILDLPLKEINDEGMIASLINSKIQMAHRSYGVVKITRRGWDKVAEINGERVLPMDAANKIALIAHEVMYEITKSQGDKNSERARLATGYLFKSNTSKRYIKKAIKLINR